MTATQLKNTAALPTERGLFYGGAWHAGKSGRTIAVTNPATGEDLGVIVDGGAEDVDAAVRAAHKAFPGWRDTPVIERARIVRRAAGLIRDHAEELATIDSIDSGNPYIAMLADMEMTAELIEYFSGVVTEVHGATIPLGPNVFNYTLREPIGVVARISAFNHPLLFTAGRAIPAVVAGCTMVVKPADLTPLSSLRLAEIWKDAFPPGVFNLVTGGRDTGAALVQHPLVARIGFVGSVAGGKAVAQAAAAGLKRVSLELGGKNALIACEDADPAAVADGIFRGMNFKSVTGQSCGSTSRIYLHETIHDAVLAALIKLVSQLRIGIPVDPTTEMGCLSSQAQFDKTMGYIELAKQEGARLVYGGKRPDDVRLAKGFFVEPTIFVDVTDSMRIAREEVFGPVVSILKWHDEQDVIERANALDVGLTGSVWTKDLNRAHRLAAAIQTGYLWINESSVNYIGVPFGGYKQSGIGKEQSFEELLSYTQVKNVIMRMAS